VQHVADTPSLSIFLSAALLALARKTRAAGQERGATTGDNAVDAVSVFNDGMA
jgi:hypothetical protein